MENVDLDSSPNKPEEEADNKPNDAPESNPTVDPSSKAAPEESQLTEEKTEAVSKAKTEPKRMSPFSGFASGVGKTLQSTMQKTIQAASTVTTSISQSIKAKKTQHESKDQHSLYASGSYQDMTTLNLPVRQRIVHNPGSIIRRQKRVLVTGGAGFIGSHLVDALMKKGYDVLCADNLFSGQKSNIYDWFGHPNFEFIRHDVCNPLYVEVDEIYHLACPASPVFYQNNPIKTVKTCFVGTMYMLGLAKRIGARILLTSTSEIYGDPKVHPQPEEYWGNVNNIGIRSCYDEGKRIAETLMFEYRRMHNVDIAVARIFNTYGPRMLENDGRVVSNFIIQALKGQKLTIYGDGSQTRSFCYIDDQIRGLMSLMESGEVGPINIGNPDEYTISALAKMTCKLVNEKMDKDHTGFEYKDLPSDDPKQRQPDITKAKKLLHWDPDIGLEKGLSATIDYFVDYLGMNEKVKSKEEKTEIAQIKQENNEDVDQIVKTQEEVEANDNEL